MESPPSFAYLFFAVAVFVIVVGGFVWLVGYIGGKGEKKPQERKWPSMSATSAGPETPAPAGERELLRVSRTENDELAVFVQGQHHRHLREIADPQVGRETIQAIKAVLEFSKDWLPAIRQPAAPSTSSPEIGADQETFLAQSPPPASKKLPGLLTSLQTQTPSNLLDPLPLVDEIDDLVQQRLQKQPGLATRHIRLTTGTAGGLRVYVDQQAFDAVDDISDPQVKAIIQDAIREWESR